MRRSLKLLTAGLLVGGLLSPHFARAQTSPPAQSAAQSPAPPQQFSASSATDITPPPPRSMTLGERIRNFFSPRASEPRVQQAVEVQPSLGPRTGGVPAALGSPTANAPAVKGTMTVTPVKGTTVLTEKELEKVGHEQDYSWITGKLVREGNRWVLHYAGPYEVDRHGGSVMLSAHPELATYHSGDMICVHGKVASSGRAGATASYQIESISRIDSPNR
jgi:hypothetical protein